jgi:hypothetical protein
MGSLHGPTGTAGARSERVASDLVADSDPLPLSELVGVREGAVVEPVAGYAHAADRAVDLVQHRLVVDVHNAGVDLLGDPLRTDKVGADK